MGSSKKQTVGYRYRMGLHMGICLECDSLLEIRAGDRTAWAGNVTENQTVGIYAANLFGGDEREGGISGTLDVMMGRPEQGANAYLTSQQGGFQPGYRGFMGLVYRGLITSNNPYIKNWEVRVRSILKGWHNEEVWYPSRAAIPLVPAQNAAFYFALDDSGSMLEPTPNGQTRLANMQAAVRDALDFIRYNLVEQGSTIDVHVSRYSSGAATLSRYNCTTTDMDALKAFASAGTGSGSYTDFASGVAAMPGFFAAANPGSRRIAFFITDGEPNNPGGDPPGTVANNARAIVDSVSPPVAVHGINIDLADTTYTSIVDNTGGAVVVAGGDPAALVTVITSIFSGRIGMNPVHILYQALTDPDWGMGYPPALVDEDSFEAAANTLYAEGFGLSLKWVNQSSVKAFTQTIADHASMNYGQSRQTGKFEIQLLRQDYDVDDLPVFTKKNCRVVKYQRPALTDTVNEIIVEYVDVATGKDASTAPLQNSANIQAQGRIVSQKLSFPGVPTNALATRVGMRELQTRSTPVWKMTLELQRGEATRLKSGKPFVLDMLDTPLGVRLVLRAVEINFGTTVDAVITADCVEDVFGMPSATYVGEPTEPPAPPDTSPQPAVGDAFEVPYRELVQNLDAGTLASLPPDAGYIGAMATRPAGVPLNFALMTKLGAGDYLEAGQGDFAPTATSTTVLAPRGDATTFPYGSASNLAAIEVGMAGWLTGADPDLAELVRIDAVDTDAAEITLGRGCGDTIPQEWPIGTRLWAFDSFSAADPEQYVAGETVDAKLLTNATGGQQQLDTAPVHSVTMNSRAARPYPPADVKVNGMWPVVGTQTGPITVEWKHRDRVLQVDTLVDWTEESVGPEPGTTYTVRAIAVVGGAVLHEETGIAGTSATPFELTFTGAVRVEVVSVRDGLECWQVPAQAFAYANTNIQAFPASGTFVVPEGVDAVDVLVVAGGGGGGSRQGGGGGAGGLVVSSVAVTPGDSIAVVVGAGGAGGTAGGRGANGGNSSFGSIVAIGGGGGGGRTTDNGGANGGSGGGSVLTPNLAGGLGTSGQGNNGGMSTAGPGGGNLGGGGGGAGAPGSRPIPQNPSADYQADAGPGGDGLQIPMFASYGDAGWFAGGDGGGGFSTLSLDGGGAGGRGGGGKGNGVGKDSPATEPGPGTPGMANTGGGGGGSGSGAYAGGAGGSGVVIITWPAGQIPPTIQSPRAQTVTL